MYLLFSLTTTISNICEMPRESILARLNVRSFHQIQFTISYRPVSKMSKQMLSLAFMLLKRSVRNLSHHLQENICKPHPMDLQSSYLLQYFHGHSAGLSTGVAVCHKSTTHSPDSLCSHFSGHWLPRGQQHPLDAEGSLLVA